MREEHGDLLEHGDAARLGLLPRRGNAHNDVPEHVTGELSELTLVHRERQDIRGTIHSAIDLVQLMDTFLIR